MSTTWQGDDNSTEASISPDLRKQLEDAGGHNDENPTEASIAPAIRAQLKSASGQDDENDTIPSLSPAMRAQLKAAAKTIKIDPSEFELEAKALAGNALLKNHTTVMFALIDS